jgi:hypothetical protein
MIQFNLQWRKKAIFKKIDGIGERMLPSVVMSESMISSCKSVNHMHFQFEL